MAASLAASFLPVRPRRVLALSLVVILAVFAMGVWIGQQLPRTDQERLRKEVEGIRIQTQYIFLNNYLITLGTLTPFAGIGLHLFVQYTTGTVFGAIAALNRVSPLWLVLASTPVFVPEYAAYVLSLTESFVLSYAVLWRRVELVPRLRQQTWKTALITAAILAAAALIEVGFIRLLR